jgi:hypothetical protein
MSKPHKPSPASQILGLGGQHIDRDALKNRLRERDQRQAADTRTQLEKFLGDPPPDRSALANREPALPRWVYRDVGKLPKGWR